MLCEGTSANKERAWTGMDIPCDKIGIDLFYASTMLIVGKGDMASFCFSAWLNGESLRNFAPSIFKKAIRKNILVQDTLNKNRWVKHVLPIQPAQEIKEYMEEIGKQLQESTE
jgi:hypothetical protein